MTREAKIGMLTGLGVIVLIGVLLSDYLGDPHNVLPGGASMAPASGGARGEGDATGQMAPLPVGAAYRKEMSTPAGGAVSVPAMTPGQPADGSSWAMADYRGTQAQPGAGSGQPTGPLIENPVAPVAAGRAGAWGESQIGSPGVPPMVMVSQETRLAGGGSGAVAGGGGSAAPAAGHVNYQIAAGDTLSKIAKKFYHDSKPSDVQRIVAANAGMLKDDKSVLIQGKTLVIPGVAPVAARVSAPPAPQPLTGGVVPMPGDLGPAGNPARAVAGNAAVPAHKPAVYVVQSGDTLAKIARKLAPANAAAMEKKLIGLNGIHDADSIAAGTPLKVPA